MDESVRKKPKFTLFHTSHVVPMEFFHDAANYHKMFLPHDSDDGGGAPDIAPSSSRSADCEKSQSSQQPEQSKNSLRRFGLSREALVRNCYHDLLEEISAENELFNTEQEGRGIRFVEIRGSAGIGKSAFLAYTMATAVQAGLKIIALFHSPKQGIMETASSSSIADEILCSVWINGEQQMNKQDYALPDTRRQISVFLSKINYIFMDGCAMGLGCEDFHGMICAALSPSISTSRLRSVLIDGAVFVMPPFSIDECLDVGSFLGVEQDVVKNNYFHMQGIVRYAMKDNAAAQRVKAAVAMVNPVSLINMIATNSTDKEIEKNAVHALILWNTAQVVSGKLNYRGIVRLELVSRYAEKLVAEKLATYNAIQLEKLRYSLQGVAGAAEGYAGALFEAFAIRKIRDGGDFLIIGLQGQASISITIPPMHGAELVEISCNVLDCKTCPLETVHVKVAGEDAWEPRLLWPTTNHFPTFDAYYFHTDGDVYPMQMTIARKNEMLSHPLNCGGAIQTMRFLDLIKTCPRKYKAVFVVPKDILGAIGQCKKQPFIGNGKVGTKVLKSTEAQEYMDATFAQWVLPL